MAIKDYSTTPDLNTQISGINIAEGCAPSGINNAIRQLMADVKAEKEAKDAEQAAKDAEQAAKDAEQDAAISAAQTAADSALAKEAVLPGTVIAWAANSAPTGYLLCNGAAVSRATYAKLYEAIGTTYGAGDGSTTFNLPNLTDRFIQGSGTAGEYKEAGLPNISGTFLTGGLAGGSSGAFGTYGHGGIGLKSDNTGSFMTEKRQDFYASNSNATYGASSTVQPPALTMRYYIKY